MIIFLVKNGFDYQYISWNIGVYEFYYLFINALNLNLRILQHSSIMLTGSIATFFMEKNKDTYIDILGKQIVELKNIIEKGFKKELRLKNGKEENKNIVLDLNMLSKIFKK